MTLLVCGLPPPSSQRVVSQPQAICVCSKLLHAQVHLQLVEAGQHICELQLLLNQFAEVKTKGGHKRYIDYRNAMAC